jgi:hypothetical protein
MGAFSRYGLIAYGSSWIGGVLGRSAEDVETNFPADGRF